MKPSVKYWAVQLFALALASLHYWGAHAQVVPDPNKTGVGGAGGSGTVTSVSVTSANGLAGSVANPTTTPAITLSTGLTGIIKGNGTALSAATSGTDYAPATSGSSILKGNGAGGFSAIVSGTDLKTINSTSIVGAGDIAVSASPAGSASEIQYRNAGAFGAVPNSAISANGMPTFGAGTITGSDPYTITQTWNNSGVAFTASLLNVTNTASAAASLLGDWQVGGASKFKVDKSGNLSLPDNAVIQSNNTPSGSITFGNGGSNPYITIAANSYNFKLQGGIITSDPVIIPRLQTLSAMPTCNSGTKGARATVSDATLTFTSANFGASITGGGSNVVPAMCDGTAWKIG